MITIKLAKHITVEQLINWKKKGALIELQGFNVYVMSDSLDLVNLINQANRVKL